MFESKGSQNFVLNNAQVQASDPAACVYVSASAGTGKTKVLTDRFLRLMLSGAPINKILCLTFTNVAANEMRERILLKLRKWYEADQFQLITELESLTGGSVTTELLLKAPKLFDQYLENSNKIQIQTIHSLCQKILSISPKSNISSKLINDFERNKLYELAYKNSQQDKALEPFFKLLLTKYEDPYIKSDLIKPFVYEKIQASRFAKNPVDAYKVFNIDKDFDEESFQESLFNNGLKKLLAIGEGGKVETFEDYIQYFITQKGELNKRTEKKFDKFPQLEDLYKELLVGKDKIDRKIAANYNNAFINISCAIYNEFEKLKTQKQSIDYSDLLLEADELLNFSESADEVLYSIDCSIDHVLVDEAQDLSQLQWNIVYSITNEFFAGFGANGANRTIFIVGDYKQAIYSFQGANPEIFKDAKNHFGNKARAAHKIWKEVDLEISYRSNQTIVNLINKLSKKIFPTLSVNHQSFKGGEGVFQFLEPTEIEKENDNLSWRLPSLEDEIDSVEYLHAENLAEKVNEWISSGLKQPQDIMILLTKRGELMRYIISSFRKRGIPIANPDKSELSKDIIIQDLLAVAKFVLLPIDEFNLAYLLKSPFVGLSEEKVHDLCFIKGNENLYSYLKNEQEIINKLKLLQACYDGDIYQFYINLIELKDFRREFENRFGEKAIDIIHKFYELVLDYTSNTGFNMESFVSYIEDGNLKMVYSNDSSENKVKIMTIHGSKGLEAPVVILGDATRSLDTVRERVIWMDGFPYINLSIDCDSLKKVKTRFKEMLNAEKARLLYVAVTRAESEIYVTGAKYEKASYDNWYKMLEML